MKIILLEDIKKQGKKDDIIEVADGYGNFLIKNHQAVLASGAGVKRLNKEKELAYLKEEELVKKCNKIKKELESSSIKFIVKTGSNGKVFGTISAKQIADYLKNKKYNIDKKQIKIDSAISSLGFHNVDIELHKKVVAHIKVELVS